MTVKVVLLSGRSGSGKSTVAYEITHKLTVRAYPHVHIDGDNLDAICPAETGSELMLANLRALWASYYSLRGCETLLLSGTGVVLGHEGVRGIIEQVCGQPIMLESVILMASDAIIEDRLKQREIGTDLERHLRSSHRMAKILNDFGGIPNLHRVHVDNRQVSDIADEVIRLTLEQ